MNFTINLDKIGEFSMQNLILVGVFAILCLFIWQFSNILNAFTNFIKTKHEIDREKQNES